MPIVSQVPPTIQTPASPTETTNSVPTDTSIKEDETETPLDFTLAKAITDEISGIVNSIVALNAYIVMGSSNGMISVWDIENGEVNPRDDFKTRGRYLADKYDYDITEAR